MKRLLLIGIFIFPLLLLGCSDEISKEHARYLESFGWHIKNKHTEETHVLHKLLPETLETYKNAGLDLTSYKDKEVYITKYLLTERHKKDGKIYACVYEVNGEIIGGFALLEDYSPGVVSLSDKERLVKK
ncbi:MAG TPA: DUF4830 domain-containing protein [Bacillus sp. (in: firmicutes)]|nr:DUF4830 domain-containing protein [Bacillus sp. (in: firmicutes)]